MKKLTVLIGSGVIGVAIARRVSASRKLLIADVNQEGAQATAESLNQAGFEAFATTVDVTSQKSVKALAEYAAKSGEVVNLIHTAGVSPTKSSPEVIFNVDLLGAAHVLESFREVIAAEGAGLVVSSQAGHRLGALKDEHSHLLATTPSNKLLSLSLLQKDQVSDSLHAYQLAKRGVSLRVKAEAAHWGQKGARLNAISSGIVTSPLSNNELEGPHGDLYRRMIQGCAAGRVGTPEEVANVAALLLGPEGSFITGADLLMDGGVTSAYKYGDLKL